MSVVNGQDVEASIVNNAFMSRNSDTSTTGKVSLENVDSQNVADVQKLLEDVKTVIGITENDPNLLDYATGNFIGQEPIKTNISNLDQALQTVSDALEDLNVRENDNNSLQAGQILDLQNDIIEITSQDSLFGGNKTFTGDVIIQGDLTVNGSEVIINTTELTVEDPLITLNKNGDDASSELGGLEIERTTDNAVVQFDPLLESKWRVGTAASNSEVITAAYDQELTGLKTFVNGLATSGIDERVLDAGVTVDGVLLKDGLVDGRDVVADATNFENHIASTSNPHSVTASQVGLGNVTNHAQLRREAGDFNTFANKATPVDDDIVLIEDSEDSFNKKKVLFSSIGGGGGSGQGDINFLALSGVSVNGDDSLTNGWDLYQDAAASRPVDGTGGTASVTITTLAFNALSGSRSIILSKPNSNVQGQGWSANFSIDRANQARVLKVEFDYNVAAGTFVAGTKTADSDIIVYLYDVTNNRLIEPSTFKLFSNSTTVADKFSEYFQTSADSLDYRLIFHVATTSAVAFDLRVDNVIVTPSKYVYGTPITDWQTFTPTGSWTGAVTYTGHFRRVGDTAEVRARIVLSGAPTGGNLTINVPAGLTIDATKIPTLANVTAILGQATSFDNSALTGYKFYPLYASSTSIGIAYQSNVSGAGTLVTPTAPYTFAVSDSVEVVFTVPIQGWSSSVKVSDGFDARDVSARYTAALSGTLATVETLIPYTTRIFDTTSSMSGGTFTAPASGTYRFSASLEANFSGNNTLILRARKNGSTFQTHAIPSTVAIGAIIPQVHGSIDLRAGDTLSFAYLATASTGTLQNNPTTAICSIERLQSPQTTAQSEVVAFGARSNNGSTIGTSLTTQTFNQKYLDTHNAFNGTNFVAPVAGVYRFEYNIRANFQTLSITQRIVISLQINTVIQTFYSIYGNGANIAMSAGSSTTVYLNAGDSVRVSALSDIATTQTTSNSDNHFSGSKVG